MITSKKIKSVNYNIDTYKKKIYVYGIAQDEDERAEVINEAKKILAFEKSFHGGSSYVASLMGGDSRRSLKTETIKAPVYDFASHTRSTETQTIEPKEIVVVDGILIMAFEEVVNLLTFKVFVDTPDDVRLQRRIKRDMSERGRTEESVNKQFLASVLPMHKKFVQPHKDFTELVVDGLADPNKSVAKLISFIGL